MAHVTEVEPSEVINAVLGEDFVDDRTMKFGSSHSGHGVRFGYYGEEFIEVAAKPYWGRKAIAKANYEKGITEKVRRLGFNTLVPFTVIELPADERPSVGDMAVLLTHYKQGYGGGNTLSLEVDPHSDRGQSIAKAVSSVAVATAQLHNERVTHGDPQLKNWGFLTAGPADQEPLIFDLEKATTHSSKRSSNGAFCARPDNFTSAIKRDLERLSFSLGARLYGGDIEGHFADTVVEPYMATLCPGIKSALEFVPIIDGMVTNFEATKVRHTPLVNAG